MHTAVLDRTRAYFQIFSNPSVLAARTPAAVRRTPVKAVGSDLKRTPHQSPAKPRRSPGRKFAWLVSGVLAPAAVGLAYESWTSSAGQSARADHSPVAAVRTVVIDHPVQAGTASVVLPATFRPWQTTALHARVSGYLAAWHQDLGDHVKAGDLMAEIETPELDQELATAQALVREAVAAAAQAKAERVEAEADLKVAEAQLVRAQAEVELAKSQLVRRGELLTKRIISMEEHDTFSTQVETRAAEVTASKSDIVRRRANLETRTAIIDAREATAHSRRANVDRLQELQTFKRIVAPFDGVVTRRSAEVGMLVTAGQGSLFTMEDLSRIRVQMNVPQTYALQTSPGAQAMIRIPESNSGEFAATITRVAQSVDSSNRTMLAEIEIENDSYRFQPGIYAQVTLLTPGNSSAWTIPTNTLSMRVDGPHVAVVDGQDRIEIKRVNLGRDLGNRVVVVEGIIGGERLVVNPTDDLVRGQRIQVGQSHSGREVAVR